MLIVVCPLLFAAFDSDSVIASLLLRHMYRLNIEHILLIFLVDPHG